MKKNGGDKANDDWLINWFFLMILWIQTTNFVQKSTKRLKIRFGTRFELKISTKREKKHFFAIHQKFFRPKKAILFVPKNDIMQYKRYYSICNFFAEIKKMKICKQSIPTRIWNFIQILSNFFWNQEAVKTFKRIKNSIHSRKKEIATFPTAWFLKKILLFFFLSNFATNFVTNFATCSTRYGFGFFSFSSKLRQIWKTLASKFQKSLRVSSAFASRNANDRKTIEKCTWYKKKIRKDSKEEKRCKTNANDRKKNAIRHEKKCKRYTSPGKKRGYDYSRPWKAIWRQKTKMKNSKSARGSKKLTSASYPFFLIIALMILCAFWPKMKMEDEIFWYLRKNCDLGPLKNFNSSYNHPRNLLELSIKLSITEPIKCWNMKIKLQKIINGDLMCIAVIIPFKSLDFREIVSV